MPHTVQALEYTNSEGELGQLSGKVARQDGSRAVGSWATQKHPEHGTLLRDERRQRASLHADLAHLAPFLVPHRFELTDENETKTGSAFAGRKKIGYAPSLNAAWLSEIMGFVRRAPVAYEWGPLAPGADAEQIEPPEGSMAHQLWIDATRDGTNWTNFIEDEVQQWGLSSPGGFLVVDTPRVAVRSRAEEERAGVRPFLRFVPWSWVEDWGLDDGGAFRWIKLIEIEDVRDPRSTDQKDGGFRRVHLLYELTDAGTTVVTRVDDDGAIQGEPVDLGPIESSEGRASLPLIPVRFGRHPLMRYAGAGLLRGLDDIVLDIYNQIVELREEQRAIVFGLLAFTGEDGDSVFEQLKKGTRLLDLGGGEHTRIELIAADGGAVSSMLASLNFSLGAWALGAKRKSKEAVEVSGPRSGVSIDAEFQVDLKPLLIRVAEWLDATEREALFVAAQMSGVTPQAAREISVNRDTNFRTTDEAERIADILTAFRDAIGTLPAELVVRAMLRALEDADLVPLDADAEGATAGETVRDVIERELRELAAVRDERAAQTDRFERGLFAPFAGVGANGA